MSDGNFNRALLPHTPYASGMKAGKQIAKMRAIEVFREAIDQLCPHLTEEERKAELKHLEHKLASRL